MGAIYPVPTGRTSDILSRTRLMAQLQSDQLRLASLQNQVSTGRALQIPSDDPRAAARSLSLQRVLEFKAQYQVNIRTGESFLGATETAISGTLERLRDARGLVLTALGASTSETQRKAIVDQLKGTRQFLLESANTQFRGRYLFAGSANDRQPYEAAGGAIRFRGDETLYMISADRGLSVASNLSGQEVFGGLTSAAVSSKGHRPALTHDTKLSDLFDGSGLSLGTIRIADSNTKRDVDLKGVSTVGELVSRLRGAAPSGRELAVTIGADAIRIAWADGLGGSLLIEDLGGGRTARDLGIEQRSLSGPEVIDGRPLQVAMTLLSPVARITGAPSRTTLMSAGYDNDVLIEARANGAGQDGARFQITDDGALFSSGGVLPGDEYVEFDSAARASRAALRFTGNQNDIRLTATTAGSAFNGVQIEVISGGAIGDTAVASYDAANRRYQLRVDSTGATTVQSVINAVAAEGTFTASYDSSDPGDLGFNPSATISPADVGRVLGDTSQSGGEANTYYVHVNRDGSTGGDVQRALSESLEFSELFTARLDPSDAVGRSNRGFGLLSFDSVAVSVGGTGESLDLSSGLRITVGDDVQVVRFDGVVTVDDLLQRIESSGAAVRADLDESGRIRVRSTMSGVNFSIGENGGLTATQLGLRTLVRETRLSDLGLGSGIPNGTGVDFTIRRNDGVELGIDIASARTMGDVLDLINSHPANTDPGKLVARLAQIGNGIELVDDDPPADSTLTVISSPANKTAERLGLLPVGATVGSPAQSAPPTYAELDLVFPAPKDRNTAFSLKAAIPGTGFNGVQVVFADGGAIGDSATAVFDPGTGTLTVSVDPSATKMSTVVQAIDLEGTFQASLSEAAGPNNGSGLVPNLGLIGTTAGGSSVPSGTKAAARLSFAVPAQLNTGIRIEARQAGTSSNGVEIEFVSGGSGDVASASYDAVGRRLTVMIDPSSTRAATIVAAIESEGTFRAELDTTTDASNNGSGIPGGLGLMASLAGGAPEVLVGRDVNPQAVESVFDTLTRMIDLLSGPTDLAAVELMMNRLDRDITRINSAMAEVGSRMLGFEIVGNRIEDETLQIQTSLSQDLDTDMVKTISDMTARQAAYEASLRLIASSFQLTLMEFL